MGHSPLNNVKDGIYMIHEDSPKNISVELKISVHLYLQNNKHKISKVYNNIKIFKLIFNI